MSQHLPLLPILLPLLAGIVLLGLSDMPLRYQRMVNFFATLLLLPVAIWLLPVAGEGARVYALGNWQPPFGIVLVLDRLSALMVFTTSLLALAVLWFACADQDREGDNFHALFQFQLLGLNGAFLTGDLFNLFVFFEIMLISSYALLVFGGGRARVMAGLHYVVLNLVGSVMFLIAVGTLYAVLGTLNIADLARHIQVLPESDTALVRAAGLLLLVVFALKAAMLPLGFWLPAAYANTSAPVAALFAIMTKVGVYAIIRIHGTLFGDQAGELAGLGDSLLWWFGLATIVLSMVGVLAARHLRGVLVWLVVMSVGTLLAGLALGGVDVLAGVLYYLLHSTWVIGALFLLAGAIMLRRGEAADDFIAGPRAGPALGLAFMFAAVAVIGLPPLSGFIAKVVLLQAAGTDGWVVPFWTLLLLSGLISLIAMSRAGSSLFWRGHDPTAETSALPLFPVWLLLACSLVMSLAGEPVFNYLHDAAANALDSSHYIDAVLGARGDQ